MESHGREDLATMNDAAVTVSADRSPAIGEQREPRDIRRALQLVLATVWLVDGLLQFQPFMFTRAFGSQMLAATAQGNPSAVAHSITWADLVIGHHSVVADAVFAVVQVLIGFGIAWRAHDQTGAGPLDRVVVRRVVVRGGPGRAASRERPIP